MTGGWQFMLREHRYRVYIVQSGSRRAVYIGND
jgi:hypothetical protein